MKHLSFQEMLDNYCLEHSQKEVVEKTGIPGGSISGYRDGVEPSPERKKILSEIIGYDESNEKKFEQEVEYVELEEASVRLGMGIGMLKCGIKANLFPFGIAIPGKGNRFYYYILRKKFEKYIEENR